MPRPVSNWNWPPRPAPARPPAATRCRSCCGWPPSGPNCPLDAVNPDSNPLDELHLSSITVGQIVNQASRELGLTAPMTTSAFATSTLAELAEMLDELAGRSRTPDEPLAAPGVAPWVRAFAIDLVPTAPAPGAGGRGHRAGSWQVFATERHPLAAALRGALEAAEHRRRRAAVPAARRRREAHGPLMLRPPRARRWRAGAGPRLVAVGDRRGAAGLAKTLHLEAPQIPPRWSPCRCRPTCWRSG